MGNKATSRVNRFISCEGVVYMLLCGIALLVLSSCGQKSLAEEIQLDLDKVTEVRIQTARQLSQAAAPQGSLKWHQISGGKELTSFIELLGKAKRIEKAHTPFPLGDGLITLVSKTHGLYGLRYFIKDRKLLDIHKGIWYSFPEGLDGVLNHLEAIPIVRKWN
ncbi:hypothetical protein Tph_c20100 [Thermacetogenium phaeum DSM 12270]|uniref:Uncharacterized protein n=1 Tax=Thermacetogenium phaeum (strain ATCC BAA-254 / DSM 26808 / PB) TaxID=1089553 RepID=K4LW18_THEPS|nr:hypothetical protein [Thermacetogenium phaeum]AFV12204.1 hypothetical protein Tph_c20100 [Thermacetogenium phaeum DSM 12270]